MLTANISAGATLETRVAIDAGKLVDTNRFAGDGARRDRTNDAWLAKR